MNEVTVTTFRIIQALAAKAHNFHRDLKSLVSGINQYMQSRVHGVMITELVHKFDPRAAKEYFKTAMNNEMKGINQR